MDSKLGIIATSRTDWQAFRMAAPDRRSATSWRYGELLLKGIACRAPCRSWILEPARSAGPPAAHHDE